MANRKIADTTLSDYLREEIDDIPVAVIGRTLLECVVLTFGLTVVTILLFSL